MNQIDLHLDDLKRSVALKSFHAYKTENVITRFIRKPGQMQIRQHSQQQVGGGGPNRGDQNAFLAPQTCPPRSDDDERKRDMSTCRRGKSTPKRSLGISAPMHPWRIQIVASMYRKRVGHPRGTVDEAARQETPRGASIVEEIQPDNRSGQRPDYEKP
jgi:hypothetical protein